MAAPATVDQFLDLVRKSGVADEKRLEAYLLKMRERIPDEPGQAAEALIRDGLLTRFQAENILAGKWRRFSIGKYKVLERLGSGGMGQVFLCEHKLMRRRVAVKVLPTAKAKDSSALDRFFREARAVAALTHPNIVHAYDIDQDEELHFLVMEYVDGANFQDLIKKSGPMNVLRACHYIRQSALALQHAHEAGLVHRDIKPGNILVDRGGTVKLLDLGLARFFHDEEDLLTKKYDDGVLGTADYLSPEQALDSHGADIRADIYSLGATFYFLLVGRPPFESANVAQKLLMHQFKEPPAIQDLRKDVPAGVISIIHKMMAKNPADRYAVPAEVAEALSSFTQIDVGPPPEAEMPQLCPAVTGQFASLDAPDTAVSKNDTPIAPMRTIQGADSGSGSGPGSGKTRSAAVVYVPPRPATARPSSAPAAKQTPLPTPVPMAIASPPPPATPVAITTTPMVQTAQQEVLELAPWERGTDDTDDPMSKEDTTPHSGRSSSKSRKNLQAKQNRRNVLVIVLVLAVIVIPLIVAVVFGVTAWYYYSSQPVQQPVSITPTRLEVSKNPTRTGAYRSIQLALHNAEIGSVIELWDDVYEENVIIDPAKGPTSVTLQAAPGKEILWRSLQADPDVPIIRMNRAGDFRFKGKGITLDGALPNNQSVNELMMITSDCGGLIVEDLQFQKFARSAILVMNCTGSLDHPIKLQRLTMMTAKSEKPRAAIYFDANPKMTPVKNDHIDIQGCDFQGIEKQKAVQFRDAKIIDKGVHWPGR